ncbi:MAG: FAD:protein FMN transferase [Candidatus Omnitrophica bacterium]|nr:FAD:protein FMN transferase [Candidatus Omnitrophota bacterium]MDD5430233.1 FAD:protein FMN transferase [Candidatus Omnitrophota bacterium]
MEREKHKNKAVRIVIYYLAAGRHVAVALSLIAFVSCAKPLHKNTFVTTGTYLEVLSFDPRAAGIVYNEFRRLDKLFNLYDSSSELSRLNFSGGLMMKVSSDMVEILQKSRLMNERTRGAFDVSYGALYMFWKDWMKENSYLRDVRGIIELKKAFPDPELIRSLKNLGGMENIAVDCIHNTVKINKKGLIIDLGGIAKGYMVDKAVECLRAKGIESALINAGGDIYCLGTNGLKTWKVGIRDPEFFDKTAEDLEIADKAVATSGNYEQFFVFKNNIYSHLVDPRTGYPAEKTVGSISVVDKSCLVADCFATAFFIMGSQELNDFLAQETGHMKVVVLPVDKPNN